MDIEKLFWSGVSIFGAGSMYYFVKSFWAWIGSLAKKGDIDSIRKQLDDSIQATKTAVSGIKQYIETEDKRDYDQEQKQWDNIHTIEKDLSEISGEIKAIKAILQGKINE